MLLRLLLLTCAMALDPTRRSIVASSAVGLSLGQAPGPAQASSGHQNQSRAFYFYGPVSEESCFLLTRALEDFDGSDEPIHLHIQSTGGHLMPTFNVIDTMERIKSPVYTYVDGYAASAASLISVSGTKRFMGKRSLMLLHQLSGQNEGTYAYMKEEMANLDTIMGYLKDIYLSHSKLNTAMLKEILSYDNRWINAPACLRYGLVDEVL